MQTSARTASAAACLVAALFLGFLAGCEKKPPVAARLTGKEIFASICSRCHGTEGLGGPATEAGPGPRRFRDLEFQRTRTDEDIARTIHIGKGSGMPPFGNTFDDEQIKGLIQQVRSFRPAPSDDGRDP